MPRNRTARLAVLGSGASQRSQSTQYSSRNSAQIRRRVVVGVLVVLALALITVSYRESSGSLNSVQSAGATVLKPFEVAADRVAQPFRDAYGYFSGLFGAKSENKRLKAELAQMRDDSTQTALLQKENARLRALLNYKDTARFPNDFTEVGASVLSSAPSDFSRQVVISAGSANGIRLWSPVVNAQGLVGQVTKLASHTAQVTLLTDETSNVAALDLRTQAPGLVSHGAGRSDQLFMGRVQKDLEVRKGDEVVTAGSLQGKLPSMYPRGLKIGTVASVGQNDIDIYKQIQVQPYVDFSSLGSVLVLVSKKPTPQLP